MTTWILGFYCNSSRNFTNGLSCSLLIPVSPLLFLVEKWRKVSGSIVLRAPPMPATGQKRNQEVEQNYCILWVECLCPAQTDLWKPRSLLWWSLRVESLENKLDHETPQSLGSWEEMMRRSPWRCSKKWRSSLHIVQACMIVSVIKSLSVWYWVVQHKLNKIPHDLAVTLLST